jgi:hypothetical protein
MLRLAAEADMAITNWLALKDVPVVREAAGPDRELAARIFLCPIADVGAVRFIGKRMIAAYLTVPCMPHFTSGLAAATSSSPC